MTTIIDGREIAHNIRRSLLERCKRLQTKPGLAIVQIGNRQESVVYVRLKEKAAAELGMLFERHELRETAKEDEVRRVIEQLNNRSDIHGIVVQLPLPQALNADRILSFVSLEKDVDGLHPVFQIAVRRGKKTLWLPALQASVLVLAEKAGISLTGKTALILAKSDAFRITTAALLARRGMRVAQASTLEDGRTALADADLVVTALGQAGAILESSCKPGAVILDVGLTKAHDGVRGDFAGPDGSNRIAAYSPVPGGIGPVTVANLIANTVRAAEVRERPDRGIINVRFSPQGLIWAIAALMFGASPFFFGGADYWGRAILLWGIAFILMLWAFTRLRRGSDRRWWLRSELWFVLFLAFAGLSLALSQAFRAGLENFVLLIAGAALFFAGRSLDNQKLQRRFFAALVLAGVALVLWSLWFFLAKDQTTTRLFGPLKNSDGLGAALLLPMTIAVGFLRSARRRTAWIFSGSATLILGVGLALTTAVSALLGLVLALLCAWPFVRPRFSRRSLLVACALLALVVAGSAILRSTRRANPQAADTIGINQVAAVSSFNQRWAFVRTSLAMAGDRPFIGVGLGLWSDYFPKYQKSLLERSELAHGLLPQYVAEIGWPGLAFFLLLLASIAREFFQTLRNRATPLTTAAVIGCAALLVAGLIDISWFYPSSFLAFWFVAGSLLTGSTSVVQGRFATGIWRLAAVTIALLLAGWGSIRFVTSYWTAAADASAQHGDRIDALSTAKLAMNLVPTPSEELKLSGIKLMYSFGPDDKAELREWAARTHRHNPLQPATSLLLGRIARADGDAGLAEQRYREGLGLDEHFVPDLAVDLAELLEKNGRFDEAIALADSQIGRTGFDVPLRARSLGQLAVTKARAELALKKTDDAHASLLQAVGLDPSNADAALLLKDRFDGK